MCGGVKTEMLYVNVLRPRDQSSGLTRNVNGTQYRIFVFSGQVFIHHFCFSWVLFFLFIICF